MIDGYCTGVGVQARLPLLSTYLGHVHPANTYWYLSAAPELLAFTTLLLADSIETSRQRSTLVRCFKLSSSGTERLADLRHLD